MEESVPQGKTEEHLRERFEKEVLPRLLKEGKFPVDDSKADDLTVADVSWETTERFTDHFASLPYFVRLKVSDSSDPSRFHVYPIIIKFITQNLATRGAMETDTQFKNEAIFYNEIVPVIQQFLADKSESKIKILEDIIPTCHYAHIDETEIDYAIVVMKDMRSDGFTTAKSKVELDYNHCLTSFQKIGRFHALSYAMKLDDPDKFEAFKTNWIECRYEDDNYKHHFWAEFYKITSCRALDYLQNRTNPSINVPIEYINLIREKILADPYKLMQKMIEPSEPLSVLCHGDFCRNNILYRVKDEIASDCRLFDFQTIRYANPSIDLTFFVYMNTTEELREKHFDELMSAYHESLTSTVAELTNKSLTEISKLYPLRDFFEDFDKNSIYGYMIAAFFLPMMMCPGLDEDEFTTLTPTQMAEKNAQQGGEPVTIRISEILQHMYKRKCYL